MNSTLVKVRAGAYDVVAFDGRLRVVRRRDGAAVGSLPIVDEPTFGDALKETVDRSASTKSRPSVAAPAASSEPEPKKKRRARAKAQTVEPAPAASVESPDPAPAAENLEKNNDNEKV